MWTAYELGPPPDEESWPKVSRLWNKAIGATRVATRVVAFGTNADEHAFSAKVQRQANQRAIATTYIRGVYNTPWDGAYKIEPQTRVFAVGVENQKSYLYGFNAVTGAEVFKTELDGQVSTRSRVVFDRGIIYVPQGFMYQRGSTDQAHYLLAVNPQTGGVVSRLTVGTDEAGMAVTMVDGMAWVETKDYP